MQQNDTKSVDVFLDTGVSVKVPRTLDTSTNEGVAEVKRLAKEKFLAMLAEDAFDINIDGEYDDENILLHIRSTEYVDEETDEPLYWSNEHGWVSFEEATGFTKEEAAKFTLLPETGYWC